MGQVTAEVGRGAGTPSTMLAKPAMTDRSPGAKAPTADGNDSEPQTDGGTRRRFLGAAATAAALSALPAVGSARGEQQPDIQKAESFLGATRKEVENGSPVSSMIELKEFYDTETEIVTTAFCYDDEPSEVEVAIDCENAKVSVSCSPERAREVAAELELAADEAEGGG